MYTSKYLTAYRESVHWLDEAQLVPDVRAERHLRWEYIQSLDALMGWHMSLLEITRLADDFTENINRYGLFEDVVPCLKRWKQNHRLGMLSDAMPSILEFMDQWGILDLFDVTVISTQVGAVKPDPRMFATILRRLDAEPGDCLFVDDRASNLEGALAAGMKAVQMARPAFLPQKLWDGPVVNSLEALDKMIEA